MELAKLVGKGMFDYPKHTSLIQFIIALSAKQAPIVLDSFAGSGTTGHATLALNDTDGQERRFILIQLDEELDEESAGYKAGFREIIDITAERVRRVITGVPGAKDETLREGLGGGFTYCELGDPLDLEGFLDGGKEPAWEQVARYVAYTATGQTFDPVDTPGDSWFAGEAGGYRIHLLYRPEAAWMRGDDAALDEELAQAIAAKSKAAGHGGEVLVFASHKFLSQKRLSEYGLTFCQLPYAIHRIMGDAAGDEA